MELSEHSPKALSGLRILDFTQMYAGPAATILLAFLGAEVIKIESEKRPDLLRLPSAAIGQKAVSGAAFIQFNSNKKSLSLDISQPESIDIIKRLVKISDMVVENFRPGVMDKLGIGYSVLKEVNPSIIMVSISALGATGPEQSYMAWAAQWGPLSGLSEITGYPDGPPAEIRSRADLAAGTNGAFAALAALVWRQRTGQGAYVDVSGREALTCSIGEILLDYVLNGRSQTRKANQDDAMAPHNCYPCQGEDQWLSIAIASDEEWASLCTEMGNPGWTKEERFSTQFARWENLHELDKLIAAWTKNFNKYELMERLQRAGVAAVPSFSNQDLFNDAHCKERELFAPVDHPELGRQYVYGAPWKLSATPPHIESGAPLMGADNKYVLYDLLGIKDEYASSLL